MDELLLSRQKRYRATGVVMFTVAVGLLVARIIAQLLPTGVPDLAVDVIFSTFIQVGILVIATALIYTIMLKKNLRQTLELSNFRKVSWKIILLCIPLGVCVLVATIGISTLWYAFISQFGYSSGSSTPMPSKFSIWRLLLELLLTALLPGFCEEFTNRGGFLTTMRSSFSEVKTIIIVGLAFGLFHQNITQVFYTSCFGMLMALLTLRTKSVYPAMIIHFVNNGLSVYTDYAYTYSSLPLHDFLLSLDRLTITAFPVVVVMWLVVVGIGLAIFLLILKLCKKERAKKVTVLSKEGGITILAVDDEEIEESEPVLCDRQLYKPTLRDNAFYIGALVVTAITTLLTFWWGIL